MTAERLAYMREYMKKYRKTERGKALQKAADDARRETPERRAYLEAWRARRKAERV